MEFEITNDEEAQALINSIISDLQEVPQIHYKIENLKEIRTTINELITYYKI